jgi:hypothetical protein
MHKQYALLITLILSASAPVRAMDPERQKMIYLAFEREAQETADGLMQIGFQKHEIQERAIKDAWNDIHVVPSMATDPKVQLTEDCSLKFHNYYAANIFRFITSKELKALAALRFVASQESTEESAEKPQNYESINITLQALGRYLVPAPQEKDLIPTHCDRAEIQRTVTKCEQSLKLGSWIIETVKRVPGQAHTETIAQALKHLEKTP